jgi:hypothetical protein
MDKAEASRQRSKRYYDAHKETIKSKRNVTLSGSGLREKLSELNLKPNTLKTYLSSLQRLETIFPDMTVKNAKPMISAIDKSDYSTATKRVLMQTLLFMITKFDLSVPSGSVEDFKHYLNVLKLKGNDELQIKMDESVLPWADYLSKVRAEYGTNSKQFLIASLYKELTLRDDFQLKVVSTLPKTLEGNYIVIRPTFCTVVITTYKTSDTYGLIKHRLSKPLSKMIRDYVQSRGDIDYLFGNAKLSPFITQFNKTIGVDGGVNLYRHMAVAELMKGEPSPEERVRLAELMRHSVFTQMKYLRKIT